MLAPFGHCRSPSSNIDQKASGFQNSVDISLLRALPSDDALRLLSQIADIERTAGAWSVYSQAADFKLTPRRGHDHLGTTASLNLSGWPVSMEQVEALVTGSSSTEDPRTIAAARGYFDLLRLIAARYDEIP